MDAFDGTVSGWEVVMCTGPAYEYTFGVERDGGCRGLWPECGVDAR